jgi:hypothetical protein
MPHPILFLDHIVLATPDLEQSMEAFYSTTVCQSAVGGSHPRLGSKNALAGLEELEGTYIELLGPDPDNIS